MRGSRAVEHNTNTSKTVGERCPKYPLSSLSYFESEIVGKDYLGCFQKDKFSLPKLTSPVKAGNEWQLIPMNRAICLIFHLYSCYVGESYARLKGS
jgi:hypothetical protein